MGYKLNGAYLAINMPFKDSEGTSYPANWIVNASKSDLAGVPTGGITWVDEPSYDQRFYWGPSNPKDMDHAKKSTYLEIKRDMARIDKIVAKIEKAQGLPKGHYEYQGSEYA